MQEKEKSSELNNIDSEEVVILDSDTSLVDNNNLFSIVSDETENINDGLDIDYSNIDEDNLESYLESYNQSEEPVQDTEIITNIQKRSKVNREKANKYFWSSKNNDFFKVNPFRPFNYSEVELLPISIQSIKNDPFFKKGYIQAEKIANSYLSTKYNLIKRGKTDHIKGHLLQEIKKCANKNKDKKILVYGFIEGVAETYAKYQSIYADSIKQ